MKSTGVEPAVEPGALVATALDPDYGKYPLVSHSVTPNTAALLSLRATGQTIGNFMGTSWNIFAMSCATLNSCDRKQTLAL